MMKRIVPIKNTVLCEKVEQEKAKTKIILLDPPHVDLYRIIDVAEDSESIIELSKGDIIMTTGKGDSFEFEGKKYNMFPIENVVAKIF